MIRGKMTREEMIEMLVSKECIVTFTKVDGTARVMPCTLNASLIPTEPVKESAEPKKEPRKINESVIPVFCTDKREWRSFRVDSVISIV